MGQKNSSHYSVTDSRKTELQVAEPSNQSSILLTPQETWKTLKISRSMCYHLIRTGEIKSIRVGRAIRIPKAALLEWLESKMDEDESDC